MIYISFRVIKTFEAGAAGCTSLVDQYKQNLQGRLALTVLYTEIDTVSSYSEILIVNSCNGLSSSSGNEQA